MIYPNVKCINCKRYRLTYWDKIKLITNSHALKRSDVTCPKCGFKHKATGRSKLKFICWSVTPLLILLGGYGLDELLTTPLTESFLQWALLYLLFIFFIVWPMFIQVDEWKPWRDVSYLPDSRLKIYFIYLVLPICYVLFFFFLGKLFFG